MTQTNVNSTRQGYYVPANGLEIYYPEDGLFLRVGSRLSFSLLERTELKSKIRPNKPFAKDAKSSVFLQ